MTSLVDAESVLAIDIGSLNTRALLFDVVDGQYHFISAASAPTTDRAPFHDISEGLHHALLRLQEVTGRTLVSPEARLILPTQPDGSGVDRLAITCSAGPDLNLVTMGLLSDVSLQSALRLAGSTYGQVVESIGLNDQRRPEAQLDAVLLAHPDLIILAGGTDKGATRSIGKLVELVSQTCRIFPKDRRPPVLYCGNQSLNKKVKEALERDTALVTASNLRPTIDLEDLSPAETTLAKMAARIQMRRLGGLEAVASLASAPLLPSAFAMGRIMRFLSELSDLSKPTLGVDLGAGATTLAVASAGSLQLNVYRSLGIGTSLHQALQTIQAADVAQWLPFEMPLEELRDHLYQKSLFPAALPMTPEMLSVEQALARQLLRTATQRLVERYPGLDLSFERIFLSGAALAQAPSATQSLLIALDGLQPVGINMFMLDPYGLSQALGSIAGSNTLLPAQIIDSGVYANLATVLCPVSDARPGTTIMRLKISFEEGSETRLEIKQGSLVPLPIRHGQIAHLDVDLQHGAILDPCLPRLRRFKITGGLCGAVVDARGRPVRLPEDPAARWDQLIRWAQSLDERRLV